MKRQYTAKDHIAAAFRGEYTDRVPVTFLTSSFFGGKLAGFSIEEMAGDTDKNAEAILRCYDRFRPDYLIITSVGDPQSMVGSARTLERRFADKSTLAQMRPPDPTKRGKAVSYQMEVCEKVLREVDDAPVGAGFFGPWSAAMEMRGDEQVLYDTMDDPQFVHDLMRFATALSTRGLDAINEMAVELWMFEPSASCSVVSPRIYRDFIKPYHEEIVSHFRDQGKAITVHICGYLDPIMEDVVATGVGAVSIDGPSSLEKLVQVTEKKAVIIGNVETSLFVEGTKEQIEESVRNCVEIAAKGSAYILASGCEIPINASAENVKYFLEAAHKYGRYWESSSS
jgi:uroporphyrinogen decarboxylase